MYLDLLFMCEIDLSFDSQSTIQIDQKAVDLQQRFGRVCYSSTGSVKILCYSESSNTSMEDVSKN